MRVEGSEGDVLRVEAEATWLSQSGSVLRGASLVRRRSRQTRARLSAGQLVAAWDERGGASPGRRFRARSIALAVSTKLEGAPRYPFRLEARQTVAGRPLHRARRAVALEQNGCRELKLYASADFHRLCAAGDATLTIFAARRSPLSGALDDVILPVTPAGDGIGDPSRCRRAPNALFGFEVKRAGEIGVGLRAEPDRVEARLLDASGKLVGEGLAQIVKTRTGSLFPRSARPVGTSATTCVRR